ncbi:MAG: YMGG-like glycine zipper-containing protein [Ginsengibacter sp.]
MKKIILALATVTTFAACNSKKDDSRNIQLLVDSSAYNNNMYSDTSNLVEAEPEPLPVTHSVKSVTSKTTAPRSATNSSTSTNTTTTSSSTTQTAAKKQGWSSAAKGAVIGAGAGAIGGAIISKKKPVKGAVIGGVVGAAGGYIIGKDIDKKNGR